MNEAVERMLARYHPKNWKEQERALREILQEIAFVGLWRAKFFEHAVFYGGTALRILHGLDRFSEDLDFTLYAPDPDFQWKPYARFITDEIKAYGFSVTLQEKKKTSETAIRSAFLKTNTQHALLKVGLSRDELHGLHPKTAIRIKIEIDTNPIKGFQVESYYLKDPLPVTIPSVAKSDLFASKMHAALYRTWKNRVKGRDWYDVVWFARQNIPLNLRYFSQCLEQFEQIEPGEVLNSEAAKELVKKKLQTLNIEEAKADMLPFIRDSAQIAEWSHDFFLYWLERINFKLES